MKRYGSCKLWGVCYLIVFNLIQFILKKILNLILNFWYFFPVFLNSLKKNNWYNDVPINKQIEWLKIKI